PPATKNPLTGAEKDVLRRWIAAGAEYKTHWAFVAPKQAPPPKVRHPDWPRNAIDHFVFARLEAEGLRPSPRADRYTLVRRLYLDLIGLPPTPEEADAFVRDESPDAWEKVVDRLLGSPHYGERWARRWLDPLEVRFHAMTDRVNTTATVWLGLTLGCAQCHTHKFDPIPHREYYGMMAFLNNADEPEIDVPSPAIAARRAELEKQIATLE